MGFYLLSKIPDREYELVFENGSEEWCTCERPADDAGFPLDQLVLAAGPNDETLASSERRATLAVYCHDGGTEYRAECDVIQPSFSPEIQIVLTDGTAKDKVEIEVPQEGETYTFEIRSNFKLVEILSECEWALCKLESVSEDSERKEYVYSAAVNVEKSQQPSERTSEIVLGNILTIDGKEVTASVTLAFMQEAANGIRYTTTDGQKITISENGMNVVSHVYEDGYGFIELGEILTEIPNGKFNGCSTLKTIELPYSVTTIGNSAFADCSSLESIELPENLTTLGTSVFYDCIALKSIEIPAGVRSLPSETFYNCTALENALLPDGMTEIGESAFRGSSSLKSIEIPDGIRSLPRCTFYQCTALENVVLPDGMTKIWESVFFDCSSLKSIEIPDGVVNLPYCTFCHYIKTMYELNERYGWTKFVVVVPSIAIREGVLKSFESMQEHFAREYNGKRMQYFVYNSKQLSKIDAFASDAGMHVIIINTQAFNTSMNEEKSKGAKADKAARIIFDRRDEFGSRRPIDVLSQCHPIMIIDEPQSVLGVDKGNKTRKGLALFKPLFTLLYSATHRKDNIYNMMFRLDAIDAYNQKLVKKIEVKGIKQIGSTATNGYVYLEEIIISKGNPQARINYDVKTATGTRQTSRVVGEGFNLYEQSGELNEYRNNFIVERIDGLEGTVRLVNGLVLHEGDAVGAVNEDYLRRIQIRETIRTHLERERQLFGQKIKVLSLFFIDHVDSYRLYEGTESKGKFAKMFEEEYRNVLSELMPTFGDEAYLRYLSDPRNAAEKVHQGYFSMDKKGKVVESKGKEGENEERAFDLIMKDKERLLSLKEPVRFIFSHSALKEGWDNPNVFQICTLKNSDNETKKRQEVGRGMRLCVNQNGERQDADVLGDHVFDTNILTVIASESYDDFAKKLQTEMAEACGDRPIIITPNLFEGKPYNKADGTSGRFDLAQARAIYNALIRQDYVDDEGALTAEYHEAKRNGTLDFGKVNDLKDGIIAALDTVFDPSSFKPDDGRKPKAAKFQKENFDKKEFQNLLETH